jgi:GntR family transcriptional regulator, transcriptional repressor for pyruvate dehydrogenase complex
MSIKLNRSTLAEQVAAALVERIEGDGLKPGDPLPSIARLAEEFSVSKPIIREALKTLEGRDLIEISNGRTPIVKPISSNSLRLFFERAVAINPRSLIELLEVRRGLEIQSVLLAAQNHSEAQAEEMRRLVEDMSVQLSKPEVYTELDVKLHLLIASASQNGLMFHLIQSIRDVLTDTVREGLRSRMNEEQRITVQTLHEEIVDAILKRDPAKASEAMAQHFDDAINAIYRSMMK